MRIDPREPPFVPNHPSVHDTNMQRTTIHSFVLLVSLTMLAACSTTAGERSSGPDAPIGTASSGADSSAGAPSPGALSAGMSAERTRDPIAESNIVILVSGLACPKCASNIDVQLTKIRGARVRNVDMKYGLVSVDFSESPHPSSEQLAKAVDDAGLTWRGWGPAKMTGATP